MTEQVKAYSFAPWAVLTAGVSVSFYRPGDTFPPKTLRRIIDDEARWKQDALIRLKLTK
jgi:hypothetical protein